QSLCRCSRPAMAVRSPPRRIQQSFPDPVRRVCDCGNNLAAVNIHALQRCLVTSSF
ncbi:hypothetical protein HAX54_040623, partial [Datura stramonium]|nr:hypothetical protein [Datura stramonium]